jgi:hypothetical protein
LHQHVILEGVTTEESPASMPIDLSNSYSAYQDLEKGRFTLLKEYVVMEELDPYFLQNSI